MTRLHLSMILLAAGLLAGCGDADVPVPGAGAGGTTPSIYRATIRRTSFGIPHILADDLGSVAFGLAYAGAQDFVCTLADQIVKVRSERSATFGRGDKGANLTTDFAYKALDVYELGQAMLHGQSNEMKDLVAGYVAGYNH